MDEIKRSYKPHKRRGRLRWGRIILAFLLLVGFLFFSYFVATYAISWWDSYVSYKEQNSSNKAIQTTPSQEKPIVPFVSLEQKSLDRPLYILVMGKDHHQPSQIDALYLFSVNVEQKIVDIIGIPPNSKIKSRDGKSLEFLNSLYSTGQVNVTKAVIEDIFHIEIPYYVLMTENDFKQIIDNGKPIEMYVEVNMEHLDEEGKQDIFLHKGYQDLNGDKALQYMRFIDKEDTLARLQRQERLIKLFLSNEHSSLLPSQLWNIYRVWDNFETNISTKDAAKLIWDLKNLDEESIRYYILPGVQENLNGKNYWAIDPTEAQRLVGITMTGASEEQSQNRSDQSSSSKSGNTL